jgi:hypothetical protein
LQLSPEFPLGLFWWDRGQVLADLRQILENAVFNLVLLLQFLLIQPQLFSGKFTRAVISMLMTVRAKHNQVGWFIRSTLGPLDDMMDADVVCPTPARPMVFQAYVRAVNEPTERLQRLEQALQEQVNAWRVHPVVEALQALRGVPCTVAVTTVAELGDLTRVDPPRQRMQFLGLIPAEYASGERRRQGSLTNAGHTHARHALVEGAWAYRYPANVSRHLQRRLETPPKAIQDISWQAQVRLCQRYRRLLARGQPANQVGVAMARALVGCMWAMATHVTVTPSSFLTKMLASVTEYSSL